MSSSNNAGAADRLAEVRRQIPDSVLRLAYHAALPVVVDPGLLNLFRVNFFLDPPDTLPFEAEAALLLSPLFREIGDCLYEMPPEVRNVLLVGLQTSYGSERVRQVALLLQQYSASAWSTQPQLERAQQLTALNFVDSVRAAQWLESLHTDTEGAAIGQEWYVAMRHHLSAEPQPDRAPREVARAIKKLRDKSQEVRLNAVQALAGMAQLPGTDITDAGEALLDVMRYQSDADASDVKAAVALLRILGGRYAAEAAVHANRDLRQRAMASGHPDTPPIALTKRGVRSAEMGRFEEANSYYEQALGLFRQTGDRHNEGRVLTNLGNVYVQIDRFEDARAQWQAALNIMRELDDQMATARLQQKIAATYQSTEDLSAALTALEEVVAIYRGLAESGPDVMSDLAVSLNDLAQVLNSLGRASEAVRLYRELLPDQERVLGPDHPDILVTRRNIAFWTGECGEPAEALRLYRELLPDQERVRGADHHNTLAIRGNIACWVLIITTRRPVAAISKP
jgi:tetratricopeptide (TPR) repeat protein